MDWENVVVPAGISTASVTLFLMPFQKACRPGGFEIPVQVIVPPGFTVVLSTAREQVAAPEVLQEFVGSLTATVSVLVVQVLPALSFTVRVLV
jgi:hypothetical protein